MGQFIDLAGQKFGRLTVIERTENYVSPKGQPQTKWLCKCDCGNEKIVCQTNLKKGKTQSCGCKRAKYNGEVKRLSTTRIYKIWSNIKTRCYNPKNIKYKLYGGKGIIVCNEWLHDFQAFYDWSMANGYADNLTIDRINANGNYEPSNCRWVDYKTQNNHTSRNHLITYKTKTQTMKQWADEQNIPYQTLAKRINELDWDIERALTTKLQYGQ